MRSAASLAVLVGFAIVGCAKSEREKAPARSADVERLTKLAEEMKTVAREADAKRTKALVAALTTIGPKGDGSPCSVVVPIVGTEDMKRLGEGEPKDADVNWRSIRAEQMSVVTKAELTTKKSPRLEQVEKMIAFTLEGLNAGNAADTEKWLRYYGDVKNKSWEMVVVADTRVDPEVLGDGKFRSGVVLGRAYVYSHPAEAVVCVGDVAAKSSELLRHKPLTLSNGKDWNLVFDLENETYRAAARSLVAAGPRAAEGVETDGGAGKDAGTTDAGKDAATPKDASRD